jgi:hypothetical protein
MKKVVVEQLFIAWIVFGPRLILGVNLSIGDWWKLVLFSIPLLLAFHVNPILKE